MLMLFYLFATFLVQTNDAEKILKRSDESRTFTQNSKIELILENYKQNKLDSSEKMDVHNKGKNKSLVFLKERNNQLVLTVNENMWIYFPKTRKPMRITPFQRLMGNASNGDIARLSYSEDYTPTLIGKEIVKEQECFKLELIAKSKSSTYRKITYWVSKLNYLPIKADYYMISGKHFKTAFFEDYRIVHGKTMLGAMRFFKVDQPKSQTIMKFLNYSESTLPNKYYNKNYLRNIGV